MQQIWNTSPKDVGLRVVITILRNDLYLTKSSFLFFYVYSVVGVIVNCDRSEILY